jgi:YggT family protein
MTLALVSLIKTISIIFRVMFFAIIGSVILSWVAPNNNHPLLALINEISSGVLDPVRKYIPAFGGLDFSPLFALILFNQLEILLNSILRSII